MASQNRLEIYKQHQMAQQKYAYFLLAAVGACVGFALTQTKDLALNVSQTPLVIAMLGWGLSFCCGCLHLRLVQTVMHLNILLLRSQQSGHEPSEWEEVERDTMKRARKSGAALSWQLGFFAIGVVAYVYWHISEMIARIPT